MNAVKGPQKNTSDKNQEDFSYALSAKIKYVEILFPITKLKKIKDEKKA